jgi:O-antigen ligase
MLLPLPGRVRQLDMLLLVPLVAALVPLLIFPGLLAYFDITPKIAILLCGTALMLLYSGTNMYNARALPRHRGGRWLIVLAVAQWLVFVCASLFSSNRALSFNGGIWRRFGLISETGLMLFTLLTAAWLAVDANRIRVLLRAAVVSGAVASCYGIAQYFGWDPLLPAPAYHVGEGVLTIVRPPGTLGHADYFAAWLVIVVFLAAGLIRLETGRFYRIAAMIAAALAASAIVLSGTRAALLGLLCGGAVLWLTRPRRSYLRTAALAVTAGVISAVFFFSPAGIPLRARLHWSIDDARGGARLLLWRDSLRMSAQRPVTGFGPETFSTAFPRFESAELASAYPDFYHESPHNIFLDALTSEGLAGLLVLLAWCALGLAAAIRACRLGNPLGPPLAAALAALLVTQQFSVFIVTTALYFYLLVSLLVIVAWPSTALDASIQPVRRWVLIPSTVLALFLFGAATQVMVADRAYAIAKHRIATNDIAAASRAYRVAARWQPDGPSSDLGYSLAMQQAAARTPIFTDRLLARQEAMEAAIRAAGNAEDRQNAWYNLAELLAQQNDAAGTERALRNAIAWAPNWFKPHWALAKLLALTGRRPEALEESRIAVERDGGHDAEVAETWKQLHLPSTN